MKAYGTGIVCPHCQCPDTEVKDSRPADAYIRRRRLCMKCFGRFTTYEVVKGDDENMKWLLNMHHVLECMSPRNRTLVLELIDVLQQKETGNV